VNARDELGFEIGAQHRFEQAVLPHAGNWQAAHVSRLGMAFNAPLMLIVRKVVPHVGTLPAMGSFMALEPDHLAMHAMYVDGDTPVVRIVEAEGRCAPGSSGDGATDTEGQ
jgi:hypothetical protein